MRRARLFTAAAVLLAWTCKDSTAPVAPQAVSLIVPDSVAVLESDSILLHAQLTDSLGRPVTGQTVVWLSGDTSIVSVSAAGMVHFRRVGRTSIASLAGGLTGRTLVTAVVQIQQMDLGSVYAQLSPTACAVTTKGSVYCLDTQHEDSLRLLATNAGPVKQVAVGTNQSCLLTTAGAAYCWGTNVYGQLGYDTALVGNPPVTDPVPVKGGHTFVSLSAGIAHTCGLTSGGAVYCWGNNSSGQLGNGDSSVQASTSPLLVTGGLVFQSIGAGDNHTCAVSTVGVAYCWGSNLGLGLGSADTTISRSFAPVTVSVPSPVTQVVAGDAYGCTLVSGSAWCWGNSEFGQLGMDTTILNSCSTVFVCLNSPHAVSGGLQFQMLSAHAGLENLLDGLTCGLTTGGDAYCWGRNLLGEAGDGTTTQRYAPVPVAGGLKFGSIAAGDFHACGISTAGTVYCWGYTMGPTPVRIPDQP